jgi:hypothetical protein
MAICPPGPSLRRSFLSGSWRRYPLGELELAASRPRKALTLALMLVVLAVVALVGWAMMSGGHATWMDGNSESPAILKPEA